MLPIFKKLRPGGRNVREPASIRVPAGERRPRRVPQAGLCLPGSVQPGVELQPPHPRLRRALFHHRGPRPLPHPAGGVSRCHPRRGYRQRQRAPHGGQPAGQPPGVRRFGGGGAGDHGRGRGLRPAPPSLRLGGADGLPLPDAPGGGSRPPGL